MENRTFNTILYCMDHGEDALKEKLMSLSIEDLKNTFRYNRIDRTTNLQKKSLTADELISKIMEVSSRRAHHGDAFREG